MTLSAEDRRRVADAIAEAEATSSAEIRCVELPPPGYLAVAAVAGLLAVLLPGMLVVAGWRPNELGWTGGWTVIDPPPPTALQLYIGVQVGLLLGALVFGFLPWTRYAPVGLRRLWTRRAANRQFAVLGMTHTQRRTAILVALAPAYRQAAVIVDSGLSGLSHAAVRQDVEVALSEAMRRGALGDGLVAAIARLGFHLAQGFPATDDRNELPDHVAAFRAGAD